jgi:NAD(P)H-hydrate repair Nnr-like enzyme with NAD(P)H-hydrate dehydratase domain
MIAALLSQFPAQGSLAAVAAVYLHGRCGEIAAAARGERSPLASTLLDHLAEAYRDLA